VDARGRAALGPLPYQVDHAGSARLVYRPWSSAGRPPGAVSTGASRDGGSEMASPWAMTSSSCSKWGGLRLGVVWRRPGDPCCYARCVEGQLPDLKKRLEAVGDLPEPTDGDGAFSPKNSTRMRHGHPRRPGACQPDGPNLPLIVGESPGLQGQGAAMARRGMAGRRPAVACRGGAARGRLGR
jgi:hypothetical protein